jgi:hypothetical protein
MSLIGIRLSYLSECIRKKVEAFDNLNQDPTNLRLRSIAFSAKHAEALELRNISRRALERANEEHQLNPYDDTKSRVLIRARAMFLRLAERAEEAGAESTAANLAFFGF